MSTLSEKSGATALMFGLTQGAAAVAGKLAGQLANAKSTLDLAMSGQLTLAADRDAYKALAEALINEQSMPVQDRRLSDPAAHAERAKLLAQEHRMSWENRLQKFKKMTDSALTQSAINDSRKNSKSKIAEYPAAMRSIIANKRR